MIQELNSYFNQFNNIVINRQEHIEVIKRAILLGEHILLEGRAGVAKTYLASLVFDNIKNSKSFKIQFSKFMDDTELFSINFKTFREDGILEYRTVDSPFLNSEFLIIDEFNDGNDSLKRALNSIMNERVLMRNNQSYKAKLRTAILTSNYKEENSGIMEAVKDRILFKLNVEELQDQDRLILLDSNRKDININQIDYSLIDSIGSRIDHIKTDRSILRTLNKVISELKKNVYISDRTALKLLRLVKLEALLNNRDSIRTEDINALKLIYRDNDLTTVFFENLDSIEIEAKIQDNIHKENMYSQKALLKINKVKLNQLVILYIKIKEKVNSLKIDQQNLSNFLQDRYKKDKAYSEYESIIKQHDNNINLIEDRFKLLSKRSG